MVANILIAIGFFFTGLISGMWCTVKAYQKALDEWKKSGDEYIYKVTNTCRLMYEL